MSRGGPLAALLLVACTSYEDLPLCRDLARRERPSASCAASSDVARYEKLLADEILRQSDWEYPDGVPLHVTLRPDGRVGVVCVGKETAKASWSARDRVAASLPGLRRVRPGPACLAGTTLDLTSVLARRRAPSGGVRLPYGTVSCDEVRGRRCVHRVGEVCGVFRDGRLRTYPDACEACQHPSIVGYLEFPCRAP